jgi:multidrug efflux pump subunit AcrA (membrane-fusion protein)
MTAFAKTFTPLEFAEKVGQPIENVKKRFEDIRKKDPSLGSWNRNIPFLPYQQQRMIQSYGEIEGQPQEAKAPPSVQPQRQPQGQEDKVNNNEQQRQRQEQQRQQQEPQRQDDKVNNNEQQRKEAEQQRQQQLLAEYKLQQQQSIERQQQSEAAEKQRLIDADLLSQRQQQEHEQRLKQLEIDKDERIFERKNEERQQRIREFEEAQQRQRDLEEAERQAEIQRRQDELKNINYWGLGDCVNYVAIGFAFVGYCTAGHLGGAILGLMLGLFDLLTIINAKRKHREDTFFFGFLVTCLIAIFNGIFHNFTFTAMFDNPSVKIPSYFDKVLLSKCLSVGVCLVHLAALWVTRQQAKDDKI